MILLDIENDGIFCSKCKYLHKAESFIHNYKCRIFFEHFITLETEKNENGDIQVYRCIKCIESECVE